MTLTITSDNRSVLDLLEDANAYFERSRDQGFYLWKSQFLLGLWHLQFGNPRDSFEYADRLARVSDDFGDVVVLGHSHEVRGLALEFTGDHSEAGRELTAAVDTYSAGGFTQTCFAHCLDHVALWLVAEHAPHDAALAVGAAEAIRAQHAGSTAPPYERQWHDHAKSSARDALGASSFDASFSHGHAMAPDEIAGVLAALLEEALQDR